MANGMKALSENIISSYHERKGAIGIIKGRVMVLQDNVRIFLAETRKFNEEIRKDLKADLRRGRKELSESVDTMRKDFKAKEKKIRIDLLSCRQNWQSLRDTLSDKRARLRSSKKRVASSARRNKSFNLST